ncbi:MAG: protease inhibitor I42 family protein [bacterium]
MLSRVKILLISFLFIALPNTASIASELTLTEATSGKAITLYQGEVLTLKLPSNPTTGYSWSIRALPKGIVSQEKERGYGCGQTNGHFVGMGGMEIWKFRGEKPGVSKLVFSYVRSWEKGVPAVRVLKQTVIVTP